MTTREITGGTHSATSYSGIGSGLTNIAYSGVAAGTANHVVVNDANGALSSMAILGGKQGGFTYDISSITGPLIAEAVNGNGIMSTYDTAASANSIVQKSAGQITVNALSAPTVIFSQSPATTGSLANVLVYNSGLKQRNLTLTISAQLATVAALTSAMSLVAWPDTQGNGFRLNAGLFEATTAGVYAISANIVHSGSTTTFRNTRLDWTSGGTTLSPMQVSGGAISNTYAPSTGIAWCGKLIAGDTVGIYTGAVTVATSTTTASRITVTKLA